MLEIENVIGGRYKIVKILGRGRFGQTYLAEDSHLPGNPQCVVKQLIPKYSDLARRLFDNEAKVLYQLGKHPQIPSLFAHFEDDRQFYLVQEFIDGHELIEEFRKNRRWSEKQVICLLREILEILVFVHEEDIIHRDVNPKNLMRRHEDGKLILIDFGAVKDVTSREVDSQGETKLTVAIGTPGYMPCEQSNGRPKMSSDIYAVGIVGIQAITGLEPMELVADLKNEIIWRDRVRVSSEFADILDKMVRYDFRDRYFFAAEALQAIQNLVTFG